MTKHTLHQVLLRAAMRSHERDTVQHLSGKGNEPRRFLQPPEEHGLQLPEQRALQLLAKRSLYVRSPKILPPYLRHVVLLQRCQLIGIHVDSPWQVSSGSHRASFCPLPRPTQLHLHQQLP